MPFTSFLINSKHWLSGSIRIQLTPAERSVWADLLALANESRVRGVICRAKGLPYSMEYLATYLSIDIELLQSTIEKCLLDYNADEDKTRISIDECGCIVINNWGKYQVDEKRWRDKKEKEKDIKKQSRSNRQERDNSIQATLQGTNRTINETNKALRQLSQKIDGNGSDNMEKILYKDTE